MSRAEGAAETKRRATIAYVEGLAIRVPVYEWDALVKRARANYNGRSVHILGKSPAGVGDDVGFTERICVNYLRHCCTNYEAELERLHGKVGVDYARKLLRRRVLTEIGRVYTSLAREAEHQKWRDV